MSQKAAHREAVDTGTEQLLCELQIEAEDELGVATITLNRPDKRNALSDELTPALRETLLVVEAEPRVGCVVITGAGKAFCAGGDVSGMGGSKERPEREPSPEERVRDLQHRQATLTARLHELAKPTLAVLPGPAAGAGLSIALACDLRIAGESAFVVTAFRDIGFSGDYGSSWFLTQLVGTSRARELLFLSERVGAREGERLGLINRVFPDETLRAEAHEIARRIATGPAVALRLMKQNLNRAERYDLRTCLDGEAENMIRSGNTEDHREAARAFLEKRAPVFRGR